MPVALWSIDRDQPRRLDQRHEWLESQLETWVKSEPSMVADGLTWIGQQVVFPDLSRLDLLGMTREGGLVLAELKRGVLGISALAQALHYVLWLGSMESDALIRRLQLSEEDAAAVAEVVQGDAALDVSVLLIGTGRAPELDRAAEFLVASGLNVPVKIVTFTPFVDASGQVVLARETEEHEVAPEDTTPRQRSQRGARVEWVLEMAETAGVRDLFESAIETAQALGLKVKPWKKSITVVPPFTHGRTLIYLRPLPSGQVQFGYGPDTISELYGGDTSETERLLGDRWVALDESEARRRLEIFAELMQRLQAQTAVADDEGVDPLLES